MCFFEVAANLAIIPYFKYFRRHCWGSAGQGAGGEKYPLNLMRVMPP